MNGAPTRVALAGGGLAWARRELGTAASELAAVLRARPTAVLATLMDNSPAWVVADLATSLAGVVHVPLPAFFTPEQLRHALVAAGVDTLLTTPQAAAGWPQQPTQECTVAGQSFVLLTLPCVTVPLPRGTAKITFTSGSTAAPKGVCLSARAMRKAAAGVVVALRPLDIRRHLCVLPLAVLLENLAGVLAPLARGATLVVPPLAEVGLTGSSGFDPETFQAAVNRHAPESLIVLPQMLRAWTAWLQHKGQRASPSLKIVAVGGAAVGERLLLAARERGIPAHEGYGLSECASVQTLNLPGQDRPGSAGRPLPHAHLRIARDGEIEVAGSLMAGYLGDSTPVPQWWPTGDLGSLDEQGFLHVHGRKKNVLITGFGRNVSPEWVETALRGDPRIAQAVVFGDGQRALSAVLWPLAPGVADEALGRAVDAANATLPDYARVGRWVRARGAFDARARLATPNGRPQRAAILALHADALGLCLPTPDCTQHHALLH